MTRLAILLLGLVSLVSCDNWRHEFWKTSNNLNKGYVKNCDPSESTFYMDWYPDPMVKGEDVTFEGNYTFPEDFEYGRVEMKVDDIPFGKFSFDCSMITENPCREGYTAVGSKTIKVPRDLPIPAGKHVTVKAYLINRDTGHRIGCAEARVSVEDRKKAIPYWLI